MINPIHNHDWGDDPAKWLVKFGLLKTQLRVPDVSLQEGG